MASSIEEALYNYIQSKVSGIRIYWMQVPDDKSYTRPYVTMDTIASPDEPPYVGERGSLALVQLSVWGQKSAALNMANVLVDLLDQFNGKMGTYEVFQTSMNGPMSIKDPDFDDLFQFIVEAEVNYSRGWYS